MKKTVTKNGQEFYIWGSRKEALKDVAVILEGMKCAFVEGAEMDDSLYIKYKDGRIYSFDKFGESGKFRKTNFDTVIYSNDVVSVVYGEAVLRNVDNYDEIYSPEKDSEEKNWYFDEKEPETTEAETAKVTKPVEISLKSTTCENGRVKIGDVVAYRGNDEFNVHGFVGKVTLICNSLGFVYANVVSKRYPDGINVPAKDLYIYKFCRKNVKRYYFTDEINGEDCPLDDHIGNIRGAIKVAQQYADENNVVVYINDCGSEGIVEVIHPESEFEPDTTEPETATDPETAETEGTTDPEVGKFVYDVHIHNAYGWDTYTLRADGLESAEYKALKRVEYECGNEERSSIDVIRIYMEDKNDLLKEIIVEENGVRVERVNFPKPNIESNNISKERRTRDSRAGDKGRYSRA